MASFLQTSFVIVFFAKIAFKQSLWNCNEIEGVEGRDQAVIGLVDVEKDGTDYMPLQTQA